MLQRPTSRQLSHCISLALHSKAAALEVLLLAPAGSGPAALQAYPVPPSATIPSLGGLTSLTPNTGWLPLSSSSAHWRSAQLQHFQPCPHLGAQPSPHHLHELRVAPQAAHGVGQGPAVGQLTHQALPGWEHSDQQPLLLHRGAAAPLSGCGLGVCSTDMRRYVLGLWYEGLRAGMPTASPPRLGKRLLIY